MAAPNSPRGRVVFGGALQDQRRPCPFGGDLLPYFTAQPVGRHRIGLCRTLSCALAGSDKMAARLEAKLGVKEGAVTPDGRLSFERMECLGACEQAPALLVNEELHGKATEALVDSLVEKLK